jgi:hypothetical protein
MSNVAGPLRSCAAHAASGKWADVEGRLHVVGEELNAAAERLTAVAEWATGVSSVFDPCRFVGDFVESVVLVAERLAEAQRGRHAKPRRSIQPPPNLQLQGSSPSHRFGSGPLRTPAIH